MKLKTLQETLDHVLIEAREEKEVEIVARKGEQVYRTTSKAIVYVAAKKVRDVTEFLDSSSLQDAKKAKTAKEFQDIVNGGNVVGTFFDKITVDNIGTKPTDKIEAQIFKASSTDSMGNVRQVIRTARGTLVYKTSKGVPLSIGDSGISPANQEKAKRAKTSKEFMSAINTTSLWKFKEESDSGKTIEVEKENFRFPTNLVVQYKLMNNVSTVTRTRSGKLVHKTSGGVNLSVQDLGMDVYNTNLAKSAKTEFELIKILKSATGLNFTKAS